MTKKKRFLSLVLAISLLTAIAPWSSMKASASFTGALQFDTDGKFIVMQIADVQVSSSVTVDSRVTSLLKNAIARYHPDLCVFTGDNQTGGSLLYKGAIDKILAPLTDTNTKFAVTFGNHEEDGWPKVTKQTQYDYYKSKGGSNFIDHDVSSLSGVGSGVIPIYKNGQTSGTPAFQVYLMDSGMYASSGYDCPYTDQIDYYIQRSIAYPNVPSLWYMHIIVPDVYTEVMSGGTLIPEKIDWEKSAYGTTVAEIFKESPCPADTSTYTSTAHRSSAAYGSKTLYESWVAYGNMLGTYYGHDHKNSFVSTTDDGIDIGYGKAPTLESYNDGNPGCRIFELDAGGTYHTFNVTEADLAKANINFNANGGTGYMLGQLVAKNSTAVLNANTYTRAGYSFDGWSTTADGSTAYDDKANYAVGTSDVTLYAKWTAGSFSNITFDANGGSGGTGPTSMQVGTALTAPVVTKTGYTFNGWSPSVPATVPFVYTTYTAQWVANTYTVNYNSNGGSGSMASALFTYDDAANLSENAFTRTGHTFLGWSIDPEAASAEYSNGENVINLTSGAGAAVTLYAVWSANQYSITFDANGGSGGNSGLLLYGDSLIAPTVTRTGYTFAGWSPSVPETVPAENTIYTAQWNQNPVLITFDANGGSGGTAPALMYPGSPLFAPEVSKPGYSFIGWSPELMDTVPFNDQTYVAQWAVNTYRINFDNNGGTGGGSWLMQYGVALTAPEVTKTGCTFKGWSPSVPGTVPAGDTTYTAQWSANSYTITFDANGGTGGTTGSFEYGTVINIPEVSRTGYIFAGWSPEVPGTVPAADQTYTAQWTAGKYTITFDANGGTGSCSVLLSPGQPIEAPAVERTGYTFAGWSPVVPLTSPAKNTTYTALWTINSYRMTFEGAGGLGGTSVLLEYNSPLIAPSVTRYGYNFSNWSPEVPASVPAADTTFTAQWIPQEFLITFDANGGIGGSSATMEYGAALNAPAVTRTGYLFLRWQPSVPATVPAKNVIYKALWTPAGFNVTFDANGGNGTMFPQSIDFDAAEPLDLSTFSKSGFSFAGWNTAANGTGTAYADGAEFTMTTEGIVLYAQWTANPAAVIIDSKAGSTTVIDKNKSFIYGLEQGITQNEFENGFVSITGNGRLVYNSANGTLGTGTKVDLIDNATNEILQTFTIVIFGDVNGDGIINGIDAGIVVNIENYSAVWDSVTDAAFIRAADVNGDGVVNGIDSGIMVNSENYVTHISQVTGQPV